MNQITVKLSVISLVNIIATLGLLPLLPPHIRSLGGSHLVIGISDAIFAGIQVIAGPVIGSWSDLRGRKFVASITLCISALCCCVIGLTSSLVLILVSKMILGMVEHTQILCKAITGDLLPKEELTKAYGQMGAMTCLGIIIGPIAAGHLVEVENGFFYVCTLTALLYVLTIGLIQTVEQRQSPKQSGFTLQTFKTEIAKIVNELTGIDWKTFWEVFTLRFVLSFSVILYFTSLGVYAKEKYDLSQKSIGYLIALFGILSTISIASIGYIKTKFYNSDVNNSKLMLHLFMVLTIGLLCLNCARDYLTFLIATVPFGCANAALSIITTEVIMNKSTSSDRGVLTGASESVMGIGRFAAPLVSGIMAHLFGGTVILLVALASSILGTLLCLKNIKYTDIKKTD